MQTKTKYEEMALKELRGMPDESLPQVLKILRSFREGITAARTAGKKKSKTSGLCGIWVDERVANEIIEEIHSHRTGFGGQSSEHI